MLRFLTELKMVQFVIKKLGILPQNVSFFGFVSVSEFIPELPNQSLTNLFKKSLLLRLKKSRAL